MSVKVSRIIGLRQNGYRVNPDLVTRMLPFLIRDNYGQG